MVRQKSPKSRNKSSFSSPSLALSDLHLRFQALEKEHQWLLKQIRRKQTELKNFLDQMRSLATEVMQRGEPLYKQLIELDSEIHALFEEIFTTRKFGKQSQKDIKGIYRSLQMMRIISPKIDRDPELDDLLGSLKDEFVGKAREESHAENHQPFEDFSQPNSETPIPNKSSESRHIRQTFLRLAAIFHPDKVMDNETQLLHNEIMKELNRAYNDGDMARLLEIEQQHSSGTSIAIDSNSLSDLEKQCQKKEIDNQLLKTQYENLKQELRTIRNTPEGETVKEFRACVRAGLDPITEMLAEIKAQVQEISKIRNFVRDFRDQKMTIKDFLRGPVSMNSASPEEMEEILEQMLEEMFIVVRNS